MSTATTSFYADTTTLANFKAWAKWLSDFFRAAGWVNTGDTGQVDWTAIAAVPDNSAPAFDIFKSTDALSSAFPIYLKIEYYGSSGTPSFYFTVGTGGTDGAGHLTGPTTTRQSTSCYASDITKVRTSYISGDSGSMRFIVFGPSGDTGYPGAYEPVYFCLSRSRDSSGNQTGDFVMVWFGGSQGGQRYHQAVFNANTGGALTLDTSGFMLAALPTPGTTGSVGGNVLVSPVYQNIGGLSNPTPDILLGKYNDFADGSTTTVTVYGVSHTYIVLEEGVSFVSAIRSSVLLRYE